MASSEKYYNNILQFRKHAEPLIQLKPMVILTDGTRKEGNALIKFIINTYLVEPDDSLVYFQCVRKGIFLYCTMIDKFLISLNEAEIIIKICMNSIQTNVFNKRANPFNLTRADLYSSSIEWNKKYDVGQND